MDEKEELARQRFMLLNIMRLMGVACLLVGVANIGGKLLPELAPWFGYALLAFGMIDVLLVPNILRKNWAKMDGGTDW